MTMGNPMGFSGTPRVLWTAALLVCAALLLPATALAGKRHVVPHQKPTWAAPSSRAKAAPDTNRMVFSVWLGWRNTADLDTTLKNLYTPGSRSYHQWLSPAQFRARFAPSDAETAAVSQWLKGQGFDIVDVPKNNLFVTAAGTTAHVEQAFEVSINLYKLDGKLVRAPNQDPSVPAALGPDVRAITGLDGALALSRPAHTTAAGPAPPPPAGHSFGPCSSYWGQQTSTAFSNPFTAGLALPWIPCGYTPSQIDSAYGFDWLHRLGLTGRHQTIAIVGSFFSPTIQADVNTFSREHRLPRLNPHNYREVVAAGTLKYPRDPEETQSWYIEQALDVEWSHAVAPQARIVYVGAANDAGGLDHALNQAIDEHLADIVSNSWGIPESFASTGEINSLNDMFEQAAAEGIGVYVASGDDGDLKDAIGEKSTGFPDSSPWVTSVGGTSLAVGSRGQRLWETGWGTDGTEWTGKSWSPKAPGDFYFGSGGGTSRIFAQPWYQAGVVPRAIALRGTTLRRTTPDIALDADPDTPVTFTQTYRQPNGQDVQIDSWIGGTSLATPLMAGMMALLDQSSRRSHGFVNPSLYRLAGSHALHDIVPSNGQIAVLRNTPDGNGSFYTELRSFDHDSSLATAPGWDNVTGLGSPNAFWLRWALR